MRYLGRSSCLEENTRFLQENTFVKAQFSGVIPAKNYEDGEMYAGSPILTLTQINTLKALINIPEIYFPKIKKTFIRRVRLGICAVLSITYFLRKNHCQNFEARQNESFFPRTKENIAARLAPAAIFCCGIGGKEPFWRV